MDNYFIMHLNRRVASVRANGTCTVYYPSFMPYSLYLESGNAMDTRLNNLNNFYHWCASRVLTLDRVYAKEILNSLGQKQAVTDKDRAQIAIAYHALSLTDVYWVKSHAEKKLAFESISLFHHSLSDVFVDVSLRGKSLTVQNASCSTPPTPPETSPHRALRPKPGCGGTAFSGSIRMVPQAKFVTSCWPAKLRSALPSNRSNTKRRPIVANPSAPVGW